MSVCAKFQLSSSSRSAWKVSVGGMGWGGVGGAESFYCQTQPLLRLGWGFDNKGRVSWALPHWDFYCPSLFDLSRSCFCKDPCMQTRPKTHLCTFYRACYGSWACVQAPIFKKKITSYFMTLSFKFPKDMSFCWRDIPLFVTVYDLELEMLLFSNT